MTDKLCARYIRVSTIAQDSGAASQFQALGAYAKKHGITNCKTYRDVGTGSHTDRPQFKAMMADVEAGLIDTVMVWKLDRLSRSLKTGIAVLCELLERDVRVISVSQNIDFSGIVGKLIASVLFAVAEMEREHIRENIQRGMAAAQAAGKTLGGRKKGETFRVTKVKYDYVRSCWGRMSRPELAKQVGLSITTIYRIHQGGYDSLFKGKPGRPKASDQPGRS